jgi:hypothetical protein
MGIMLLTHKKIQGECVSSLKLHTYTHTHTHKFSYPFVLLKVQQKII